VALRTNLAGLYQRLGRSPEAEVLLAEIEGVNNRNPFYFVYQSELALGRGDSERALELLRQALRRDTEVPEVHLAFVKVFLARGEVERARHHLERALKLDATNEQARRYAVLLGRADG
jgi:predicted Zn-dependent protease